MSGGFQLPVSLCETEKVNGIGFEMLRRDKLKQLAVCCVTEPISFVNNQPVEGSLSDLRMGSTSRDFTCTTCCMPHPDCPGHFGYSELAEPFFHIGLFDLTLQALRCVCKSCHRLLSNPLLDPRWATEVQFLKGPARLSAVSKMCGGKRKCQATTAGGADDAEFQALAEGGCGQTQPKTRKPKGKYPSLVIEVEEEDGDINRWYGEDVYRVLDGISDSDARLMGFDPDKCHPRDLLLTALPIPPPQVRPSVSFGAGVNDNELTHKLKAIIKLNQKMAHDKESGVGREAIAEVRSALQEHLATYVHNKSTYYKPSQKGNTPFKSISDRLKGKYGRVRGNLMGKRVDFSARTVITGDPNIDVDEVGVPYSVAMTLTFPERVNHLNRKRLTETVRRTTYPSANYIIHTNGLMKKLSMLKPEARHKLTLEIGDVVERHVLNGDVVLFNRQPTLHRMSMMGHRARVLPFNTFRLNLSCTTPYNADFDGDEMNLHVAQSLLTKAELIEMMMVPKNFVSPGKSSPCMGIVQDSLLGCYRLTNKETFLDKYFVQAIVMWLDRWQLPVPAVVKPDPLWTGKQVFSMLLPEISHDQRTKTDFDDGDGGLLIRRGQLLYGTIRKGVVGAAPGSLIHVIANDKGSDEVAKFINFVQRTTAMFLLNTSFSVGVMDSVADDDTLNHVQTILRKTAEDVRRVSAKANDGTLERRTGLSLMQTFEKGVNDCLNNCREAAAQKSLANVKSTNNFRQMIDAGSKGSHLNICQIAVMVGQQNVSGTRIPFGFRRRTLPHFVQDDYGETSRGMVFHGYLEGLTPPEFVFHTMGGREGLIDTAVKTADTGYLQRKLVKALEDCHASYDGTVRNAQGQILQLIYGEDGLEGSRVEQNQDFDLVWKKDSELRKQYRFEYKDDGTYDDAIGGDYLPRDTKRLLRANPEFLVALEKEYQQLQRDRDHSRSFIDFGSEKTPDKLTVILPVNVHRLIKNAQDLFEVGRPSQQSNLNPIRVIESVQQLQHDIRKFFASHNRTTAGTIDDVHCQDRIDKALTLFFIHLRSVLASKRVIAGYRLDEKAFEFLLGEIRLKYLQSLVPAGEVIGPIAAQSCGEPATQMTLNTFHNAGISSKNVTLGVPRLQELLNVSRNQKNSSMLIHLVPAWQEKRESEMAVHMVEYASLATVTQKLTIHYDPNPRETTIDEDRDFVAQDWDMELMDDYEQAQRVGMEPLMSPWVARLHFDAKILQDKKISLTDAKYKLERSFGRPDECPYFVEFTRNSGAPNPVMRLRLKNATAHEDAVARLKVEIPALLSRIHLTGINGVKKVLTTDVKYYPVDPATGGLQEVKKRALDTEGTALRQIFSRVRDGKGTNIVDFTRTASNNIPEVYRVLGIEAARIKFFLEMRAAYLTYGVFINYRHYSVLIDTMCQRGYLMAVSRTGINRSDVGPIMMASFEETVKILMQAAAFSSTDACTGVSANLLLGSQVRVGTGIFDLLLDSTALRNAVSQEDAARAGTDVDVYHGLSSLQPMPSAAAVETVRLHAGGAQGSQSAPITSMGHGVFLSPIAPTASAAFGGPHRGSSVGASSARSSAAASSAFAPQDASIFAAGGGSTTAQMFGGPAFGAPASSADPFGAAGSGADALYSLGALDTPLPLFGGGAGLGDGAASNYFAATFLSAPHVGGSSAPFAPDSGRQGGDQHRDD